MPSIARKGWHRVKSSVGDELEQRVADQLSVAMAQLQAALGDVQSSVDRLQATVDGLAGSLALLRREVTDLADTVTVQSDVAAETTELFGRLNQATNARVDALEETIGASAPLDA